MNEQYTVVTRKGQITLPASIRRALGLEVGDRVAVSLSEDGELRATLRPVTSVVEATFGALSSYCAPPGGDEILASAQEQAAERDERSRPI